MPTALQVWPGGERAPDTTIYLPPLAEREKKQQVRKNYDRSGPWGPLMGLAITDLQSQQWNKAFPSPHGALKENQRQASKHNPCSIYCTHLTFHHSLELKKTGVNPEIPSPYTAGSRKYTCLRFSGQRLNIPPALG